MEAPKIALSDAEQVLLADASIILTKNSVVDKICHLFGELGNQFYSKCDSLSKSYPQIFQRHPKVSKGEKHEELPWIMLDYPRCFDKDGHLAIRCFCWWGNYFSIQLQVSGMYLPEILHQIQTVSSAISKDWMMGITDDPWNMQLPSKNWLPIDAILPHNACYLKLAKKIPIDQWESVSEKLREYFVELMELVTAGLKHQFDETTL